MKFNKNFMNKAENVELSQVSQKSSDFWFHL